MAAAYSFRSKGNQISQIKIFKYYKIMNEISLIQKSILVYPFFFFFFFFFLKILLRKFIFEKYPFKSTQFPKYTRTCFNGTKTSQTEHSASIINANLHLQNHVERLFLKTSLGAHP